MEAVNEFLFETIKELQQLPSLASSSLGGGTNLAIRYNHRTSQDIDLFFPSIIGKAGFEAIKAEVMQFYGENVFAFDYPCDDDEQFLFQRFFVRNGNQAIKIEILQNMQNHETPENIDGVRMMTERDISLLKIMTACNRANQKDIYDLDYLTDHIPLEEILELLKIKEQTYNQAEHQTIFDLDKEVSPIENPDLLLKFEDAVKGSASRPGHSNPRIEVIEGQKSWLSARSSWRRKVRAYFRTINREFPSASPQ